ncbi:MAG: hypothetical protein ACREEM_32000 [Blastocatellia bacterium]
MDLRKIAKLKEMLLTAEDFGDPFNYFFDLMDDDEFLDSGDVVKKDDFLKQLVKQLAQKLLGKTVVPSKFLLIKMKGIEFYHAPFMIENRMGNVFYFKDVDAGMMGLTGPNLSPPTHILRFSITVLKGKGPYSMQESNRKWH